MPLSSSSLSYLALPKRKPRSGSKTSQNSDHSTGPSGEHWMKAFGVSFEFLAGFSVVFGLQHGVLSRQSLVSPRFCLEYQFEEVLLVRFADSESGWTKSSRDCWPSRVARRLNMDGIQWFSMVFLEVGNVFICFLKL